MRMSRVAWLSQFFKFRPRIKHVKVATEGKPKRKWIVLGKVYEAYTKSEARSLAKADMGFKERLPVGTVVIEQRRGDF